MLSSASKSCHQIAWDVKIVISWQKLSKLSTVYENGQKCQLLVKSVVNDHVQSQQVFMITAIIQSTFPTRLYAPRRKYDITHQYSIYHAIQLHKRRSRVTKSENFPDRKFFVAKFFRIKRVNRVNFQICNNCALKQVLQDFVHKHGPNMLNIHFLDDLDTFQIVPKLSRSSGNFPDHAGTFLHHPDSFQIIWKHCQDLYNRIFRIIRRLS